MNINDLYPSSYLKSSDVDGLDMPIIMERVEVVEMQDGTRKPCLYFQNLEKGLILNRTNANAIAAVYGDDVEGWNGHPLQLMVVPVEFNGRTVDAIRVRAKPQARKPQPQPSQPSYAEGKARVTSGRQPLPQPVPASKASLPEELEDDIPWK